MNNLEQTRGIYNKTISVAGPWPNSVLDLIRVRTNYALGFSSQNIQQSAQLQVQFIYPELSETCNWLLRSKTLLLSIVALLVRTRCVILDDVEL